MPYQFASEITAGICPEAWQAMAQENQGLVASYTDDTVTRAACDALRDFFEADGDVYFVFNSTAANSLAERQDLKVRMDGVRFAEALEFLGCPLHVPVECQRRRRPLSGGLCESS